MKNLIILFMAAIILAVSFSNFTSQPADLVENKVHPKKKGEFDREKIDSLLSLLDKKNKWMGSVALLENGKVIYTKTIGFLNREEKLKANKKTKYRIGSISKTFTATLVLKAVEEGKLELSLPINKFFPEIKNGKNITVKNLLNHRSGIYNFTNAKDYSEWSTTPKTKKDLIEIISGYESVFKPNSKAEYSNSNYVLLSFILEEVYKKNFKEILEEKIVEKINLEYTYFGKPVKSEEDEAFSYSNYGKEWKKENETDMSIPLGAGSIVSTPSDLTKFYTCLFDEKLISKEYLDIMLTIKDGYGHGIFSTPYFKNEGFGHTGGIDGFSSMAAYFPNNKMSIAICSNGNSYDNNEIALCMLSSYFNDNKFKFPNFETVELKSEELDKYLGKYSSEALPFKITISKKGSTLMAFPDGQQMVALESKGNHKFNFIQAKAVFEFNPNKKTMTLKQGGGEFLFKKE
ncbi:MAG: serine hydrolase domain-containing protein [Flavobacteriales bacterium]